MPESNVPESNACDDDLSFEDRIEAALLAHHVVDPRRLEEVDRMCAEVQQLHERGHGGEAERLVKLCIDFIREGQATKE